MKRGATVGERLNLKPLHENIVREFIEIAKRDTEFLRRFSRLHDREYMDLAENEEKDELGRIVNNFIIKFIVAKNYHFIQSIN